ncbi:MAG: hypothetical protein BGN84_14815 [Afipia sp. 62-7]|nr:transglutaminase-like cysteine peptidase [Afipia sp.]OJU15001.1 MAG: hypothetical protein BGN84_14815 [Afipia sp. 62-7]
MSVSIATQAKTLAFAFLVNALFGFSDASARMAQDGIVEIKPPRALTAEPFGLSTSVIGESPLQAKWREVARAIDAEAIVIADCDRDRSHCASQPALRFLDIVKAAAGREGLARLGEINRAINLAIRPLSDLAQYGVEDRWSSPLATLAAGAGDCEDYAIAKLVALRAAGIAADNLRLVIIRETMTGEDHAVVTVKTDGRWRVLDNRTLVMIDDSELTKYRPLFAFDAEGAKRFEQPMLAQAPINTPVRPADIEPASVQTSANASVPQATSCDEGIATFAM